jgi:uncharacterized protein with PIN domain
MECNGTLQEADVEALWEQLPEYIRRTHREFRACTACGKAYWKGSHFKRMRLLIENLCSGFWIS